MSMPERKTPWKNKRRPRSYMSVASLEDGTTRVTLRADALYLSSGLLSLSVYQPSSLPDVCPTCGALPCDQTVAPRQQLADIVARNPEDFEPYPQRLPIKTGDYGRISVIEYPTAQYQAIYIDVNNPHLGMTAPELREAAHLFNQIAEVLEDRS